VTVVWLFVIIIIVWVVVICNRLVRDRQRVLTAWSDIDVPLKRRWRRLVNLRCAVWNGHGLSPFLAAALSVFAPLR
jgi:LemA protein